MKFLASIRAKYATFNDHYVKDLHLKYSRLNLKQQRAVKGAATIIGGFLIYSLIHYGFLRIFGHKPVVAPPMMIRHGGRIEIPKGSPLRAQIELKKVELSTEPHLLNIPGWVEAIPSRNVNILAPLSGRIMSLSVEIGDRVKAGQVLATISSPDFADTKADYQKALSAYVLAQTVLKRATSVNQIGGNSIQVVQQAKNDVLQALSELKRVKARLTAFAQRLSSVKKTTTSTSGDANLFQAAETSLNDSQAGLITIRSPINGKITSLNYGLGAYINDLSAPFMTVVNLDKVWVTANVAENMLSSVHKGQGVVITFLAYPNESYRGQISFVHPELDPNTRRNQTRIELANPAGKLQPNMYANVEILVKESAQIVIPLSSVLMNNEATVVYVESSPWVCQRREIELGTEDGESVRVLSGLKPGERIVTCGGVLMNDK